MRRPGRPTLPLTLSNEERETLGAWARRPKTAQALAQRARMILGCADGKTNTAVAEELRVSKRVSNKWERVLTVSASVSSWHCRSTPRWSPAVLHSPCSADGSVPAMQMFSQPPISAATPRTDGCFSDASQSPAPNPTRTWPNQPTGPRNQHQPGSIAGVETFLPTC